MSAVSSSTADQPATPTSSAAPTVSESKPAATASPTTSEYELSSDDEDDDPEVVEVTPPTRSKKRKATVDLSESTPVVRRKTLQEDTQTVRNRMATELQKIQVTPMSGYTVARHKSLSSFVRSIFTAANEFHHWQPRDDPQMFQLLDEMKHRIGGFKDSCAQKSRRKAMDEWLQAMTASSFVPCLDLQSLPPKRDPRAASVEKSHGSLDLEALIKPVARMWNKLRTDTSSDKERSKNRGAQSNWASRCNDGLRALFQLAKGSSMTRKECAQLEELLYLVRLIMPKSKNFRKKALKLVPDLLALFPPSARPKFKNLELCNSKKKASS
ncbi:hypothetical protein GN244_ATG13293 [Phytophthora infestans]|uniref:Uncharacterized protein n=1 Tax=Phytophthora infestans TaxID=4787 RepID=A0A833S6T3_PHYIN|nr:hypothetical protein GN244_ATG13293 [Phytophthora infestans]